MPQTWSAEQRRRFVLVAVDERAGRPQASLASTWCHAKLAGLDRPEKLGRATTRGEQRERIGGDRPCGFGKRTGGDWRKIGEAKKPGTRGREHGINKNTRHGSTAGPQTQVQPDQQGGICGIGSMQKAKKKKKDSCTLQHHGIRRAEQSAAPARPGAQNPTQPRAPGRQGSAAQLQQLLPRRGPAGS